MLRKMILLGVALLATPASAQFGPCVPPWCAAAPPRAVEPRAEPREPREHRAAPRHEKPRAIVMRRSPAIKRWQDMEQDEARNWLKAQTDAFCKRYQKDEACKQPESR